LTQYFNPEQYSENGFNFYVLDDWFSNNLSLSVGSILSYIGLTHDDCALYDSKILDLSQFETLYSGMDCSTYTVLRE